MKSAKGSSPMEGEEKGRVGEEKVEEEETKGEASEEEEEEGTRVGEREAASSTFAIGAAGSTKGDGPDEVSSRKAGEKSGAVPPFEEVVVVPVGVGVNPLELAAGVEAKLLPPLPLPLSSASVGSNSLAEPRMWCFGSESRRRRTGPPREGKMRLLLCTRQHQ